MLVFAILTPYPLDVESRSMLDFFEKGPEKLGSLLLTLIVRICKQQIKREQA